MPSPTSSDARGAAVSLGAAGERLARIARGTRVAPAYLFESADATGPREAARWFAAALLCEADARPCLVCPTCRRVRSGSHPDVHRQGRDKATVISVDALAALLERAHASPKEGRRQVFLVDPAEAMAPEAVARYLKTLEEPPPTTTFVLVTTRPDRLPDAVRSRCQRVRFPEPGPEEVRDRLVAEGVDATRAAVVARWANGSVERARRLAALEADLIVDALAGAALARVPGAATAAEAALAALRARAGAVADEDELREGGDAPPEGAPGERMRRALEDVFHALCVLARDRAAGREGGPLAAMSPDDAAASLERLGRLAGWVRRNVSPASLLLDATLALRRP
ncbi:MAG: hypothetical protein IT460_08305 [Planctomycetes bacterium]|nr:hypothetical protein [Planctomycetota bacterium]